MRRDEESARSIQAAESGKRDAGVGGRGGARIRRAAVVAKCSGGRKEDGGGGGEPDFAVTCGAGGRGDWGRGSSEQLFPLGGGSLRKYVI